MESGIQKTAAAHDSGQPSVWPKVFGVLFLIGWLAASGIWFAMSMMGVLMANDSGAVSSSTHTGMILGVLCGQGLTTFAGIAGGLAFFWRRRRTLLIWAFVMLLSAGALWQYQAVQSFMAAAGSQS